MIDFERELNDRQLEAVRHFEGPLLVLAGAGSGKTRVITYRIAYLIEKYRVNPYNIIAMTFTNKAAGEMKERVKNLLGKDVDIFISTFHSACAYFLRRYAGLLNYKRDYTIYDEDDQKKLIKRLLEIYSQDTSQENIYRIMKRISSLKDGGVDITEYQEDSTDGEIMRAYQKELMKSNAMDFSDLLLNMVKLMKKNSDVANALSNRFRFILVDEFQDTNRIQMELLLLLLKRHRNICVVGDDDQSIYRWRGATVENILEFDENFPDARVVKLEQNYRSSGNIIAAAAELINYNEKRHKKTLFTRRPAGENITFYTAENDIDEANFIVSEILRLKSDLNVNYGDFAILVRTNAQMRILEEKLKVSKIPYEVIGGVRFYERKEIKDIISYLRVLVNPDSDLDFERIINVPPRGFGEVTISRLREISAKNNYSLFEAALRYEKTRDFALYIKDLRGLVENSPAKDIALKIVNDIKYREYLEQYYKEDYIDRIANVDEFINSMNVQINGTRAGLVQFLESISLMSDIDSASLSSSSVSLMTIHSAKGLEFSIVFIPGFEENLIPHFKSLMDSDELAEERRLLYVAITRARDRLYLSYAKERYQSGMPLTRKRSRFFEELPHRLFTFLPVKEIRKELIFSAPAPQQEGNNDYRIEYLPEFLKSSLEKRDSPYRIGMRVSHSKFGIGVIRQIEGTGDEMKLLVFFEKHGYKKLLPSYVKII